MRRLFGALWDWWKSTAHAIGAFQTKLVLTLFYLVVFAPLALLVRGLRRCRGAAADPLPGAWRPRETRDRTWADLRRQS